MQETTKCETVYKLPSDELIQKLGIDDKHKIDDIKTHHSMGGFGYPSKTKVEIILRPIIKTNENSTTTCSKSVTLEDIEFMKKLGLNGRFQYTKCVDTIRRHEISIHYEQ